MYAFARHLLFVLAVMLSATVGAAYGSTPSSERVEQVESSLPDSQAKALDAELHTLEQRMRHYKVPGVSLVVIEDGEIAWKKAYGLRQAGTDDRVDTETLFQAASISKPITALATLQLVEQGQIDLDTNVNEYLKSWQVPDNEFTTDKPVTLRGIMTHSAGLSVDGFIGYLPGRPLPKLVEILDGVRPANSEPVRVFQTPGKSMSYSGGGTTVQQLLLEDVTEQPFADLMQEMVLEPLGMTRSTFQQPLPEPLHANAAVAHQSPKPHARKWNIYPEQAAAGLWTTPSDLARAALAIRAAYRGQADTLLDQATAQQMLSRSRVEPSDRAFGLGPHVTGQGESLAFDHGGGNIGFRCFLVLFVQSGDGAVIMTNGGAGRALYRELLHAIATAYDWPGDAYLVKPADE